MEKLRNRRFVPLYYFLESTCLAVRERDVLDTDPVTFQVNGSDLTLSEKRTKACKDYELSYNDFHDAQECLIDSMTAVGYPDDQVERLAVMYTLLDRHRTKRKPHGDIAIQRYAEQTRRAWHDAMEGPALFDISIINDVLLKEIYSEAR